MSTRALLQKFSHSESRPRPIAPWAAVPIEFAVPRLVAPYGTTFFGAAFPPGGFSGPGKPVIELRRPNNLKTAVLHFEYQDLKLRGNRRPPGRTSIAIETE